MKSGHSYLKRVGRDGEDLWQCVAAECRDSGPLRALLGRTCKRDARTCDAERDLRDAVDRALAVDAPVPA